MNSIDITDACSAFDFYPRMPIADRQGVDISFTVCLSVCNFVRLRISPARTKLYSGVKFCTVVQGRPGQGIFHFAEL